jgi:2-polyprenyl-3-methyl-5-hydroxy-6-metoxy-1,4-benzoquinol methylase
MASSVVPHPSSYRDPAGFLFYREGILYRQVNKVFKTSFEKFTREGLYQHLVDKNLLVSHQLIEKNLTGSPDWHATLVPETIPFISYPYEWCFDMLKDAALLTLEVAREAINYGMILKDASAYNIQLHKGRMIFIDTLSFEKYDETKPWKAYRQFCEHFFAPLALMHYLKQPLQSLSLAYPDGIPLDFASKLLPLKSKLNLHTYLHIHLQASMSSNTARQQKKTSSSFTKKKLLDLLRSLTEKIQSFSLTQSPTVWSSYYQEAGERGDYLSSKKQIVADWLSRLNFKTVLDAGANEGKFSEIAAKRSAYVLSADLDHSSVNALYHKVKKQQIKNICPIIIDFANPSPAIGVNNEERPSFLKRTKVDLVLALALIHHLALAKNVPFDKIASMFSSITHYLLIEFVPSSDEKVLLLSENKKELLLSYSEETFVNNFEKYFSVLEKREILKTGRTLYLMETRQDGLSK